MNSGSGWIRGFRQSPADLANIKWEATDLPPWKRDMAPLE